MKNKSLLAAVFGAIAVLAPLAAGAKDWTHVKVGIEGAFPPWNLMDSSGKLAGFDVDLINNLCSRAKVDCELIAGEWNAMIPSLNAGKFDDADFSNWTHAEKKSNIGGILRFQRSF